MIKKQLYEAPATKVLELRLEGVIALSNPLLFGDTNGDGGNVTWDED